LGNKDRCVSLRDGGGAALVHDFLVQDGGAERYADHVRQLLALYPPGFTTLDQGDKEPVVNSSVAFAKAVRPSRRALHICYVYTPTRYAWDLGRRVRLLERVDHPVLRDSSANHKWAEGVQ
jgi:hypothetical protein